MSLSSNSHLFILDKSITKILKILLRLRKIGAKRKTSPRSKVEILIVIFKKPHPIMKNEHEKSWSGKNYHRAKIKKSPTKNLINQKLQIFILTHHTPLFTIKIVKYTFFSLYQKSSQTFTYYHIPSQLAIKFKNLALRLFDKVVTPPPYNHHERHPKLNFRRHTLRF